MRNPKYNDEFTDFDDQAEDRTCGPLGGILLGVVVGGAMWVGIILLIIKLCKH